MSMKQIDTIFNRYGEPRLRLFENGRFVDFDGRHIGFIKEENLYNYSGQYVGWYEGGIMRDHEGFCVGFGENISDSPHPLLPLKRLKPISAIPEIEPIRPMTQIPPIKPIKTFFWSKIDPISLFFT